VSVFRELPAAGCQLVGTLHALVTGMRFLKLYLVGYFILLLGAGLALWQSGLLRQIPGIWLAIGAIVAVGFGIMLAVASGRPAVTTRE
jgi:phage-related protein